MTIQSKMKHFISALTIALVAATSLRQANACTGITLVAEDGAVVFARTQEWGTFDLNSRVAIVPRGTSIRTTLPDGKQGLSWVGRYGMVGVDALKKDVFIDGMNEEAFRILDNFNLTVGTAAAEGGGEVNQKGMRSSTIWTTAYDTKNLVMQYHTMHNRRVRQINLGDIDFTAKDIVRVPMDRVKAQDIDIVSVPSKPMMPGGWNEGTVDQPTEEAVAFILSQMNSKAKLKRVVGVKKQVVNGMNYDITFELDNNTLWNAIVYRSLSGEFSIRKKAQKLEPQT
jgi:hypothetical protein